MRVSFNERSDAVCTTVFAIDFFAIFCVRLSLACILANVGDWTMQSREQLFRIQFSNLSRSRITFLFRFTSDNGQSNAYSEYGLPFRNWISANRMCPKIDDMTYLYSHSWVPWWMSMIFYYCSNKLNLTTYIRASANNWPRPMIPLLFLLCVWKLDADDQCHQDDTPLGASTLFFFPAPNGAYSVSDAVAVCSSLGADIPHFIPKNCYPLVVTSLKSFTTTYPNFEHGINRDVPKPRSSIRNILFTCQRKAAILQPYIALLNQTAVRLQVVDELE